MIDGLKMVNRGHSCTVRSAETTVRAQIVDRGAALVFTTSDDVGTLRENVSALSVPAFLHSTDHRFDKIQDGVRLVFEAEGGQEVAALQQGVVRHAREMAKSCGFFLAAPTDWNVEQQQLAESSASAASPSRRGEKGSTTAAQPGRPNSDKPKEKQQTNAAPKPEPKPAPAQASKPADKPKEKPKHELKPREGRKPEIPRFPRVPRVPRLPGPRPNPFASIDQPS
jgi:outer membrane biosynthesis protein TonB